MLTQGPKENPRLLQNLQHSMLAITTTGRPFFKANDLSFNEHLVEPDFLALEPYLVSIDVFFPILNKVKTRSSEFTWKLRSNSSERLSTNTEINKLI